MNGLSTTCARSPSGTIVRSSITSITCRFIVYDYCFLIDRKRPQVSKNSITAVLNLLFAMRHATSLQRPCRQGAWNCSHNSESSRSESDFYQLIELDIAISVGAEPSAASARPSARVAGFFSSPCDAAPSIRDAARHVATKTSIPGSHHAIARNRLVVRIFAPI